MGLEGPRAPDIVFSLEWSATAVDGQPGVAVGTHAGLAADHGTLSPYELRNTLVAEGPAFRVGWPNPAPVGNIDLAPTLAHVLGLSAGTPFEGRVLEEALRDGPASQDGPAWRTRSEVATFSARGEEWTQRLWFDCVGAHAYLAGGAVQPA